MNAHENDHDSSGRGGVRHRGFGLPRKPRRAAATGFGYPGYSDSSSLIAGVRRKRPDAAPDGLDKIRKLRQQEVIAEIQVSEALGKVDNDEPTDEQEHRLHMAIKKLAEIRVQIDQFLVGSTVGTAITAQMQLDQQQESNGPSWPPDEYGF